MLVPLIRTRVIVINESAPSRGLPLRSINFPVNEALSCSLLLHWQSTAQKGEKKTLFMLLIVIEPSLTRYLTTFKVECDDFIYASMLWDTSHANSHWFVC